MKNSNVTCFAWMVLFLALAGGSGWFVYRRAPWGGAAFVGGLIGGILLVLALSWLSDIPARTADWWRIVRARWGHEPVDGRRCAIIGTLRGHGELRAPFSRKRCVLYSYEIITTETRGNDSSDRKIYEGFAMVPLSVEHEGQRTRILARPELPLRAEQRRHREAEEAAKHYVESTTFTSAPAKKNEEKDLSHTDGRFRYDYSFPPVEPNVGACRLMETKLAPDISICALGTYRADRHALVAPVALRLGKSFVIDAAWRVVNAGIAAVVFATIALAAGALFCANYPIDAAEQANPHWTLKWWEIELERFVDRNVRGPLAGMGIMTSTGYHLMDVCEGCAKGSLEIDGRRIALQHARYLGGRAVHLSAREGDRDGVTLDGNRVLLTVDGKSAPVPQLWIEENDIETSLGSAGEYAGRITVIAPDRWIRCRVTFNTRVDERAWLPAR